MGMFDTVYIHDNRMKCKNGHDLSGQDFQTKCLTNSLAAWVIKNGFLKLEKWPWHDNVWEPTPKTGTISVYTTCDNCEEFRDNNGVRELNNWAEFLITIKDGTVVKIDRNEQDD